MSQINDNRRARAIRRAIALILILVVAPAAYLTYSLTRDRRPTISTAVIETGDISSTMTITTMIRPGAIQQTTVGRQLVETVPVKAGDQVKAGDVLITFDLSEFEENLVNATAARKDAEDAAAKVTELVTSQGGDLQATMTDLQKQISRLTAGLGGATDALGGLVDSATSIVTIDEAAAAQIAEAIAAIDTNSPDAPAQLQAVLNELIAGIQIDTSSDYQRQLDALTGNINKMSGAVNSLSGLLGNADLLALLSGGSGTASQLSSLASAAQTAVAAATQAELQAQTALDNAVETITAEIDGLVAVIDAVPGEYTGAAATSAGSLSSLLGGSTGSSQVTGDPIVVIYDNTKPKAFFQANRYDAARLAVGMPVTYSQDGRTWGGQITFKGSFASNVSFDDSSSSGLLGSVSAVSGLSEEPVLDIEMSILGNDLTDLTLGFNIEAEIQTASAAGVLLVPAEAMKKELGEYYVYVLMPDGRLEKRSIIPGIQSDLFAEVKSGLTAGEKVVLNPTNDLSDGIAVREVG